jgi:hypothetical protein
MSAPTENSGVVGKIKKLVQGEEAPPPPAITPFKRVHIIINPASGKAEPILNILNNAFKDTDVQWDVFITKKDGDAKQFAQDAVAAGVDAVAVYGGDGTVTEAANGLAGSGMPVAILPGGTANVISIELGIPGDVTEAAALLTGKPFTTHAVDLGVVGDRYFFHLGLGIEGQMIRDASREEKDKRARWQDRGSGWREPDGHELWQHRCGRAEALARHRHQRWSARCAGDPRCRSDDPAGGGY